MTTTDPYSTDDTSTNVTDTDERIEFSGDTDKSSDSPPEPPELDFEIIPTTDDIIEKLTKRWWNFFGRILDGTGASTEATTTDARSSADEELIPLPPQFTGLRIALGGDKHTH